MNNKSKKEPCCKVGCEKEAEWEIYADGVPDTTACTEHVGELLTDAKEHRIFRLKEVVPDDVDPEYEAMIQDLTPVDEGE